MAKKRDPIAFVAALADGRTCLGCDRDGEWRLMLILPNDEGRKLAHQELEALREREAAGMKRRATWMT